MEIYIKEQKIKQLANKLYIFVVKVTITCACMNEVYFQSFMQSNHPSIQPYGLDSFIHSYKISFIQLQQQQQTLSSAMYLSMSFQKNVPLNLLKYSQRTKWNLKLFLKDVVLQNN